MSLLPSEGVLGEERFHSYWLTDINTHTNTQKNSCELCWLYIDKMHSLLTWTEPLKNLCLISISAKCPPEDKRAPLQKIAITKPHPHTQLLWLLFVHTLYTEAITSVISAAYLITPFTPNCLWSCPWCCRHSFVQPSQDHLPELIQLMPNPYPDLQITYLSYLTGGGE